MNIPRPARYLDSKLFISGETEAGSAGEQPAKGYRVRLIADDEGKARSFRRVFDWGSGADQREAAPALRFRWF